MERAKTCCFTGHRRIAPQDPVELGALVLKVIKKLYIDGYRNFLSGGAIGFDLIAARAVVELKRECADARLVFAIPFRGHDRRWNERDRREYAELAALADETVYVSESYSGGVFARRNRWMVENSSVCVAYLRESNHSGTAMTVGMARDAGLPVLRLEGRGGAVRCLSDPPSLAI